MSTYRCLVDCLCQKNETDSLGRYVELVNLRAKAGETYDEAYDMLKFNDNPEGTIFFAGAPGPPTKTRGSDIAPLEKRMPPPQAKAEEPEEEDEPVVIAAPKPKAKPRANVSRG